MKKLKKNPVKKKPLTKKKVKKIINKKKEKFLKDNDKKLVNISQNILKPIIKQVKSDDNDFDLPEPDDDIITRFSVIEDESKE